MPPKQYASAPGLILDPKMRYSATIRTNKGNMTISLLPAEAPRAVNNFVFLARDGFYDNGSFHRVLKGFMVQGGCPEGTGRGGPGYRFPDEPVTRKYVKGTLAMANSGKDTNGSQFFVVHGDSIGLPPNYTIFGSLTDGIDTLDALADTPVSARGGGEASTPSERLEIQGIDISEEPINPA